VSMLRLYPLGLTPPHLLESESPQSIHEKLMLAEYEFSVLKGRGIFPSLTSALPQIDANAVAYGFIEEVPTPIPLNPEEVVESIKKTGQIPQEPEETRLRTNIVECLLFRNTGLALATKLYGRLRYETVRDAGTAIRNMLSKRTEPIIEYGRSEDPRETWLQHGLKFLDYLVKTYDKDELKVLRIAHKKGTRGITFDDITDLIRDQGLAKAREALGLDKHHTVEVKVEWHQSPLITLDLVMRFDYRRGIGFRTNIMDFGNVNQRALILNRFAQEYPKALARSWAELLFGEIHPLEHYFDLMTEMN
jgi:hypothetical protein